jgi:hypothetical protein
MSPYPPYPLFTFIGFLIHACAMLAMSFRLLRHHTTKAITYLGIGVFVYAIDFSLITILFYFFPNTAIKTQAFVFIASALVPFGTLFLLLSVIQIYRWRNFDWLIFLIGATVILIVYRDTLTQLAGTQFARAYLHPAYPNAITKNQAIGGSIGGGLVAVFFLWHAVSSTIFVRRRALILGIGSFFLAVSSLYWVAHTPSVYIFSHIIGPLGSILLFYGFFSFKSSDEKSEL